jgi:translation elongation factor EF-1alpha
VLAFEDTDLGVSARGKILRGRLSTDDKVFIHPVGVEVQIKKSKCSGMRDIDLMFDSNVQSLISKGIILSNDASLSKQRFEAEIVIVGQTPNGVRPGFVGVATWLNMQVPMKIEKIVRMRDRLTGCDLPELGSDILNIGDSAVVVLVSQKGTAPLFGRFVIRNDNVVIAAGYA